MIVTHNELITVTNKAFLGMRRVCGEADLIANMVADLQMVGLHGVKHFNNATQFISLERDEPVDIKVIDGHLIADLHGSSVACHLPVIIDYALEQMIANKHLKLSLKNCHNRWLAYSELLMLAGKGIACKAQWDNGSSPKHTLYILNRGCVLPELFLAETLQREVNGLNDMTIELSVNDFDIANLSSGYSKHIDAKNLSGVQDTAWNKGVFVEDHEWELLKNTATAILVENSEQSIRGAGE